VSLPRLGMCLESFRSMSETSGSTVEPTTVTGQPRLDDRYGAPSRLGQVAAWVVIVAGVVFVVAVIFFSGLFLGSSPQTTTTTPTPPHP